MTRLYDRTAELQLIRPAATGFFSFLPNATVIRDLRIAFEITKTLEKTPNRATITVHNLGRGGRQESAVRPLHARLYAGYDDNPEEIFSGDVYWGHSMRKGPTWVTKLMFGEGHRAIKYARISHSFKSNTSTGDIMKTLAGSMGLKIPSSISEAKEFVKQYATGFTLQGLSGEQMTKILKRHGMSWSVQGRELQILRGGEARPGEAYVISQDTGMVGSPEFGPPQKKGKAPIVRVRHKLYPAIRPGHKIKIESRDVNGVFRAETVTHRGDTHNVNTWHTEIEASQ